MKKITIPLLIVLLIGAVYLLFRAASPDDLNAPNKTNQDGSEVIDDQENIETRDFESVMLSLDVPDSYRSVYQEVNKRESVLNIYSSEFETEFDLPLDPHSDARISHVSVFSDGFASELPSGDRVSWADYQGDLPSMNFSLNEMESRVYLFQDGSPWAYFIVPQNLPDSWNQYGFIWAAFSSDDMSLRCYDDSGEVINLQSCDPLGGDRVSRSGSVDNQDKETITRILESIQFLSNKDFEQDISSLITVDRPLPNIDINSPLEIQGEAVGYWYFEGSFPVELQDAEGNVIAGSLAQAQGDWMTESFVPFSAQINFENSPDDERGSLVFKRANPSGLEENDRSYSLPIIFPPNK